jgi:hypothetical protein
MVEIGSAMTRTDNMSARLKKKEAVTIDMITPELAAQVIQKFVLPMFDGPKLVRQKTIGKRNNSNGSRGT